MVNIVLAAGYATRMYPLTENFPKPLLQIKGRSILDSLLSDVDGIPEISRHIIVTNHRFAGIFSEWKSRSSYRKPVEIIDDGSTDNENRVGAVKDLILAMESCSVDEDMMVLAADNLLDFSLRGFVDFFREKGTSVIMSHYESELVALQRTGVVVLDRDRKVLEMEEKPVCPKTHWAVPPFYIYGKGDIPLIKDSLNNGCGYDSPGNLARYLCGKSVMHAWEMPGCRIDIGNLETYERLK